MKILSFGVLIRASMGPTGIFITLSKFHFSNLAFFSMGIALTYILSVYFVPRYEMVGAAIAVSISLVVMDLVRVIFIHLMFHILTISRDTIKSIGLAVIIVVICSKLLTDSFDSVRHTACSCICIFSLLLNRLLV